MAAENPSVIFTPVWTVEPSLTLWELTVGPVTMVIERLLLAIAPTESVACTVKGKVPLTVGMPPSEPLGESDIPVGRGPTLTNQVNPGVPLLTPICCEA